MGTLYRLVLTRPEGDPVTILKNITVANRTIQFRFQWSVASEEQYNILMDYINTKTRSDPLFIEGVYTYSYNYIEYYIKLYGKTDQELEEWLDSKPVLPASILNMQRPAQITALKNRSRECAALVPILSQYKELLRWQFRAIYEGEINVGYVEPGGWYRNQDRDMCFRFVSELPYIGKNDFNKAAIEFEVGDV